MKKLITLILALLLLGSMSITASASEYSCSLQDQFVGALDSAQAGETIMLEAGEFAIPKDLENAITIQGRGSDPTAVCIVMPINVSADVVFEDFSFLQYDGKITVAEGASVTFARCTFSTGTCFEVEGTAVFGGCTIMSDAHINVNGDATFKDIAGNDWMSALNYIGGSVTINGEKPTQYNNKPKLPPPETTLTYTGTGTEQYTLTVPASAINLSDTKESETCALKLSGSWASNRKVVVTCPDSVDLVNGSQHASAAVTVSGKTASGNVFTCFSVVGNDTQAIAEQSVNYTVKRPTNYQTLLGTWNGTITFSASVANK